MIYHMDAKTAGCYLQQLSLQAWHLQEAKHADGSMIAVIGQAAKHPEKPRVMLRLRLFKPTSPYERTAAMAATMSKEAKQLPNVLPIEQTQPGNMLYIVITTFVRCPLLPTSHCPVTSIFGTRCGLLFTCIMSPQFVCAAQVVQVLPCQ